MVSELGLGCMGMSQSYGPGSLRKRGARERSADFVLRGAANPAVKGSFAFSLNASRELLVGELLERAHHGGVVPSGAT
jgi:hypothetical protein